MNSLVKFIISLSLSGSIIMIIVMALNFFLKNKFSKSWQYYIWLIVILRFLFPLSTNINIVNNLFYNLNDNKIEKIQNYEADYKNLDITYDYEVINNSTISRNLPLSYYLTKLVENLVLIWFIGFMIMILNKLVTYRNYIKFIKASCRIVDDNNIKNVFESVCKKLGIKNIPNLYANKIISTPTSLGIIKPFVVIPSKLLNLSASKLEYIFLHELIHIKYYDAVYKWFAQFTLCVHFFNPFVYLMEKKIDKLCELACDERVVKLIDDRKCYGEVIVEVLEAKEGYNSEVISMSLCDNTKFIKERLVEIMSFKRKSKINILISTIVAISLSMVAIITGVYTDTNLYANEISVESDSDIIPTDEVDKFVLEQIRMQANWHNAVYFFEHMSPKGVKDVYNILIQYSNSAEDTKIAYRCINDTDKKYTYKPLYKSKVDLYAIDTMNKTGNWNYVESLFPYMTQEGADKVVSIYVQKTGNIEKAKTALKYMSDESKKMYESQSSQDYDKMAEQLINEGKSIFDIMRLMPYMSDEKTIQILKDYIDKTNKFTVMYNTRQFMNTKAIDEVTKYYVDKTGDFGAVTAMLQFLSKDMSNYIANKYFESSYDKQYSYLFTPYLNTETKSKDEEVEYNSYSNVEDKSSVDKKAIDIIQRTGNWSYVEMLLPYMTQEGVDKVVSIYFQKTGNIEKAKTASKYMSDESKKIYEGQFSQDYDKLAEQLINEGKSIHDIIRLMPYMSDEKTIQISKDYIDKTNEFKFMYEYKTYEYMSTKARDEITKYYVDKTCEFGVVAAMLQFLSKDMSNYIANKYFESSYDKDVAYLFTPYLDN